MSLLKLLLPVIVMLRFAGIAQADDALPPTLDASVIRGLDYLATHQNRDGSFGNTQKPAQTGLALMTFLAGGHTADVGKYGPTARSAIDFLISAALPDGSFGANEHPMYGQGIATLALAEAYGVEASENNRRRIALVLSRSVLLILRAQKVKKPDDFAGGWRYTADATDSDLSLSGWNTLALRASQDVGIAVDKAAVRQAAQFVLRCFDTKEKGFGFQPHEPATAISSGVGMLCLHLLESRDPPEVAQAGRYMISHPLEDNSQYFYYGVYYTTQAAYQLGEATWSVLYKANLPRLLKLQQPDGGWPQTDEGPGRIYTTSMALLTLEIPYRLLPIYQR